MRDRPVAAVVEVRDRERRARDRARARRARAPRRARTPSCPRRARPRRRRRRHAAARARAPRRAPRSRAQKRPSCCVIACDRLRERRGAACAGCGRARRPASAPEQLAEAPDVGLERRAAGARCGARPPGGRAAAARSRGPPSSARRTCPCGCETPCGAARERARREIAERRDDARPHELDLALELVAAGGDLVRRRGSACRAGGT